MAQGHRGLSHSGMQGPPPPVKHPFHAGGADNRLDRQDWCITILHDPDIQGFRCLPGSKKTGRVCYRAAKGRPGVPHVRKICENLCLEPPFGIQSCPALNPARCRNRVEKREAF